MPSLRSLNLSENHISVIDMPGFYVTSTSLENLNLKQNHGFSIVYHIFQFLSSLPQLEILDLSQNCLTQLPEFIWSCPSLKELNVASNNLHSLPIGSTSASRSSRGIPLAFSPTSPTAVDAITISDTIEEPANVTTKALIRQNVWQSEINLSKVDEDISLDFPIASSSTLITLNLSANKPSFLTILPAHLCFAFDAYFFGSCSRSKSAVRSQRSLSVSRHQNVDIRVEETCYHRQHDTLEWLKTLNISSNQLETIPVCVNNKILFQALTVLDASSNSLKSVTKDIARLSSLSVLNLAKNKDIHTLPPELGMLSRLWSLSLKGCQLKDPLDSMVNTENCKTIEIIAYLKTILEDSKTYHHLRLMILGSDGVGKSQLWEALRAEAVQKKPVVQGESIRIAEWQYEMKKQKDFAFGPIAYSSWDFTGQREYYSTYHYFLTRRALYVVVWRVSDGDIVFNDIQRWLISIQARAPNACVILVGTHVDQVSSNPAKFPHDFLDEVEKKIRSRFMRVDADKYGLPRVLELLLINAKARSDIKVIRELHSDLRRDSTSAIMKSEQFRECMKQRMVLKFGRVFRDDIEFHGVCAFLHDTGEVVHFEDSSLRELIFVDPLWLADYLAAIVALRSHICCTLFYASFFGELVKQLSVDVLLNLANVIDFTLF
ncbi:leucine Rich repeat-containing domain protein [Dictyocaulus viviparus]|uniref:Leucine Rich repeat-containing domain protein n=1 Tax=Dictyocaulus viviparus TaxID=29172 RepID=A0A0D8YAW9_DICVI|nr:leucine Rich repeat-containing domain protein [Dictyocaulus viviparus]